MSTTTKTTQRDLETLALQGSPNAVVVLDADARVRLWNAGAELVFGFDPAQAQGRTLDSLVHPSGEDAPDETPADLERARTGVTVHRERMCRRQDGLMLHVHQSLRAHRDADGSATHFVAVLSDVTALHVQRDSEMVHARYHGLLEFAPDAIVIVNDSGRIVLFNARAKELFGHEPQDVIGESIEVLLPARLRDVHLNHRNGYLSAPRMRPMGAGLELRGMRRNGEEFPVEISLSPIGGERSRLVMSAIRDTSERKRFEQALQEKNVELERAIRAKDHFLATMSHELRTPLNAIIGFTGLMLMKLPGPLTPAQERQLTLVQSSGHHLLSLINDLLDLAKIESGRVELTLEPVRCAPVLEEVAATLRPAATLKGLALEVDIADARVAALADRRALQQIVLNLASNAVKFTAQGKVRLELRMLSGEGNAGGQVEIAVVDSGIGIAAEDQARLFEPFTQVGDRLQRPTEGTGLGLHVSRKLAELMQGAIGVTSQPGQGSRFSLRLNGAGGAP
jgi:PAS domain S-box-containing protein